MRDHVALMQLFGPLQLACRVLGLGTSFHKMRLGRFECYFEGPFVDRKRTVTFADDLAVPEMHRIQIAAALWPELDMVD